MFGEPPRVCMALSADIVGSPVSSLVVGVLWAIFFYQWNHRVDYTVIGLNYRKVRRRHEHCLWECVSVESRNLARLTSRAHVVLVAAVLSRLRILAQRHCHALSLKLHAHCLQCRVAVHVFLFGAPAWVVVLCQDDCSSHGSRPVEGRVAPSCAFLTCPVCAIGIDRFSLWL